MHNLQLYFYHLKLPGSEPDITFESTFGKQGKIVVLLPMGRYFNIQIIRPEIMPRQNLEFKVINRRLIQLVWTMELFRLRGVTGLPDNFPIQQ